MSSVSLSISDSDSDTEVLQVKPVTPVAVQVPVQTISSRFRLSTSNVYLALSIISSFSLGYWTGYYHQRNKITRKK